MELNYLGIVFRWMHMLAAITAVGGTIFIRMALLPSLATLPEESRKTLHQAVRGRWAKFVMASIAFLLISGLYNIYVISTRYELPGYYMPLFGVKFILALAIFFIASALVGRSAAFEKIRGNARFWMSVNLSLAIMLVCISGVLRMAKHIDKPARVELTVPRPPK